MKLLPGMKIEHYIQMEYDDFDNLVKKHYGDNGYEFLSDEEANNYSLYRYRVFKRLINWGEWEEKKFLKFINGEQTCKMASILFNRLLLDGHIPEGQYLIECYW